MTDKERLKKWSMDALAHKDWNGRPLEQVVTKEIQSLPKDSNGLVVIDDNLSEDRLTVFKSVMVPKRVTSPFANTNVVHALSGF